MYSRVTGSDIEKPVLFELKKDKHFPVKNCLDIRPDDYFVEEKIL